MGLGGSVPLLAPAVALLFVTNVLLLLLLVTCCVFAHLPAACRSAAEHYSLLSCTATAVAADHVTACSLLVRD
jgi:hypothetical protein